MKRVWPLNVQQISHRVGFVRLFDGRAEFAAEIPNLLERHRAEESRDGPIAEDGLCVSTIPSCISFLAFTI